MVEPMKACDVVSLGFNETVLDFIKREGGVTNTANVARRFAWPMEEARRRLRLLERGGVITRKLVANPECAGSAYDWTLREAQS